MSANRKTEVDAAVKDIDFSKNKYQIELDTSAGKITLDLNGDVAPGHSKNMIGLAKIGFYDGVLFHRVIKGFMVQGGCPLGTGTGDAGYKVKAEFNTTPHEAGVLSMARSSDPNSAGSQFFICLGKHTHLDRQYTAFGKTADEASLGVVRKIGETKTDSRDRPVSDVTIKTATVIEKAK
jgi:cyclophilin family peptidyl-prolyl cis-trans isomerase